MPSENLAKYNYSPIENILTLWILDPPFLWQLSYLVCAFYSTERAEACKLLCIQIGHREDEIHPAKGIFLALNTFFT
jgi:hypothetical protein